MFYQNFNSHFKWPRNVEFSPHDHVDGPHSASKIEKREIRSKK